MQKFVTSMYHFFITCIIHEHGDGDNTKQVKWGPRHPASLGLKSKNSMQGLFYVTSFTLTLALQDLLYIIPLTPGVCHVPNYRTLKRGESILYGPPTPPHPSDSLSEPELRPHISGMPSTTES